MALEEQGFFAAKFDQSPLRLRQSAFDEIPEVFDLPVETKQQNNFKNPGRGYLGKDERFPLYESLGIEDALSLGNIESFTNLMWPEGNPNFSEVVQSYLKKMSDLDKTVRRMILESFGLEKYIDEHMNSTEYLLRFHKYDGVKTNDKAVRLKQHMDQNFLTILQQSEALGLQVTMKDGRWVAPQCALDSLIVMIGLSFRESPTVYAFTNGWLRAPPHRVVMKGDKTRYSITLFCAPRVHNVIKPSEELVDEEHLAQFKPFEYLQFRRYFLTGGGFDSDYVLKDFARI